MTETFVHDGHEVNLTGRRATKQGVRDKTLELVEIVAADGINDYKLWVREADLYKIIGNNNGSN